MKLTESMFHKMIEEEFEKAFDEGEVIDFKKRKMLDIQKKMMNEPEWYFVEIDWGRAEVADLEVAIKTARNWIQSGFNINDASPEVMQALTGLQGDPEVPLGEQG
tara:strand:- start:1102 stop:1416 length:315 start_codon:yes stop_codon:yes gene_type:complete